MSQYLDKDRFKEAMPAQLRKSVSQVLVDSINQTMSADPVAMEAYRDNLMSYTQVMKDGKFKVEQYVAAVKYISFKLMGDTNFEAYTKTFPDRYTKFMAQGISKKDISSYVAGYNKTKLVNLIYEQTLIPTHILNADLFQKALNTQATIMLDEDVNPRDRVAAANSLLQNLKAPETKKIELEVNQTQNSVIDDLRSATEAMVLQQQKMMQDGLTNAKDVAEAPLLIDNGTGEVV